MYTVCDSPHKGRLKLWLNIVLNEPPQNMDSTWLLASSGEACN